LIAAPAHAFCGFFVAGSNSKLTNNASQAAIVRQGNRTTLTLSNNYKGPPESFAMVVPVPVVLQKDDVHTLPADVFDHIDSLSAPRLVEYWEQDPCQPHISNPLAYRHGAKSKKGGAAGASNEELGVTVEAQFTVGEYEIVILSAKESGGLETWLRQNKYNIPDGAAGALAPYVRDQMKFFVAKVDITKVTRDPQGVVVLSPLRFGYPSNEVRLPIRLGLLNAPTDGKQDLIVYVLHPSSRFEAANYKNIFVPTNLEVADSIRSDFASFYAQLFDAAVAPHQNKVVVTEYAWQTTSCDPCPTPPLSAADLVTLGAEPDSGGAPPPMSRGRGRRMWRGPAWTLTRMHVRYDKNTLSDDLVFREAKPVVGGRANWNGANESDSTGAVEDSVNNFQGRYIIRHYWTGAAQCDQPSWGNWGGPPDAPQPKPMAGKGLASAKRGGLQLKNVVHTAVPSLGIPGKPAPKH
jgi:hypothetical protein